MLVNSCTGASNEKMALISSTNKQWLPQNDHNHIDDQNTYMDSNPSIVRVMEKPGPELNVQQQQLLKCPRCDSSNTKFCYYNNYSLSQPRHFCKACKRYWTRGGTLRNVPVGGGCRKNKRIKRPFSGLDGVGVSSSSSTTTTTTTTSSVPPSNSSNPSNLQTTQFDLSSNSNHMISPLFFGFPTNPSDTTLPYSGFDLNGLFSSGFMSNDGDYNRNGFINGAKQIQDNIVRSNSSPFTSATMASVLASKFTNGTREPTNNIFQSYEEDVHNLASNESEMSMRMRDVKLEDAQTRLEWNIINSANNCQIQNDQIGTISDPSLYWNATSVCSNWLDPAPNSIGSSFQLL